MVVKRIGMLLVVAAGLLAVIGGPVLFAADAPKKEPTETSNSADADDDNETVDRYAVPKEADVKQLLAFIKEVQQIRPRTRAEFREHRAKSTVAIRAAAERIQEIATDEDRALAGYYDAVDRLLYFRAGAAARATEETKQALLRDVRTALESPRKPSRYLLAAAQTVGRSYEYTEPERAARIYSELGGILAKNPDPAIARTGAKLEGAARRVMLVGNPLELSGTLMDGSTFDWGSYRGKVVLVDFWATWCGPCLGELPNVKQNYDAYHNKGFEVVAVSLDDDRAKLEAFLEKEPKPWTNLHDGGWSDNDVATYYGIMGIPTVILVDKEGKVVSTHARGPELGRLLAEQLGPPESKETADEANEESETKASS